MKNNLVWIKDSSDPRYGKIYFNFFRIMDFDQSFYNFTRMKIEMRKILDNKKLVYWGFIRIPIDCGLKRIHYEVLSEGDKFRVFGKIYSDLSHENKDEYLIDYGETTIKHFLELIERKEEFDTIVMVEDKVIKKLEMQVMADEI